jgi:hypothetical protein
MESSPFHILANIEKGLIGNFQVREALDKLLFLHPFIKMEESFVEVRDVPQMFSISDIRVSHIPF